MKPRICGNLEHLKKTEWLPTNHLLIEIMKYCNLIYVMCVMFATPFFVLGILDYILAAFHARTHTH